ncbi:MAG: heliorhodopsin HeR [Mycobacteriaceae bacterium]
MSTRTATASTEDVSDARMSRLRTYNLVMGVLHALQAAAILILGNSFALPVTASYLGGPPGSGVGDPVTLYSFRLAWGVALFLAISAVAHFVLATVGFSRYAANMRRGRNTVRWVEYSISSSIMIVLIAQVTGISDAAALLAIFGVNASMILFGWLQEKYHSPGDGGWLPYIFGCIAGIVPWLAVALYVIAPANPSNASPPGFVYGIIVSLFVFFMIFAVNQLLQYKQVGRWRRYTYGEAVYVALSLVAKSILAWQVFANTLI